MTSAAGSRAPSFLEYYTLNSLCQLLIIRWGRQID
jgi:hypothetical protein